MWRTYFRRQPAKQRNGVGEASGTNRDPERRSSHSEPRTPRSSHREFAFYHCLVLMAGEAGFSVTDITIPFKIIDGDKTPKLEGRDYIISRCNCRTLEQGFGGWEP